MKHVYENHLGGIYISDSYNTEFLETCFQCGDSDWYIGAINSFDDLVQLVKKQDMNYSSEELKEMWEGEK